MDGVYKTITLKRMNLPVTTWRFTLTVCQINQQSLGLNKNNAITEIYSSTRDSDIFHPLTTKMNIPFYKHIYIDLAMAVKHTLEINYFFVKGILLVDRL